MYVGARGSTATGGGGGGEGEGLELEGDSEGVRVYRKGRLPPSDDHRHQTLPAHRRRRSLIPSLSPRAPRPSRLHVYEAGGTRRRGEGLRRARLARLAPPASPRIHADVRRALGQRHRGVAAGPRLPSLRARPPRPRTPSPPPRACTGSILPPPEVASSYHNLRNAIKSDKSS